MNIEQLPSHVLAKIFANLSDRKILRAVSKNFKSIIDNNSKLMQKYVLNVSKMPEDAKIQSNYSNLKLKLNFEEFKSIELFKVHQKNRIKEINIKRKGDIQKSIWFLQFIMAYFNNLHTLVLDINKKPDSDGLISSIKFKLLPNELSKLESLTIRSDIELTNLMFMFADIKTIKKLTLKADCDDELLIEFPQNAAWKLEELNMSIIDFEDEFSNSCKIFLTSQKTTLKKLRHEYSEKLCNFIMHSLPDLELLHLRIRSDVDICNELEPNDNMKSLSLNNFPDEDDDKSLEKILNHYKNIQYLNIRPRGDRMTEDVYEGELKPKNVELPNLTHLSFTGTVGSFLHGVKMPNLKYMDINNYFNGLFGGTDYFDQTALTDVNFPNVKKLSINGLYTRSIVSIIETCPKLQQLNLSNLNEYDHEIEDSDSEDCDICECYCECTRLSLKTFFDKMPELKIVGLLNNKDYWNKNDYWKEKIKEVFTQLNREVTIKIYDNFQDMMKESWPLDMIGDIGTHVMMNFVENKRFIH
jgi:hypothetical protein